MGAVLAIVLLAEADVAGRAPTPAAPAVAAPFRDLADLRGIGTEPVATTGSRVIQIELPATSSQPSGAAAPDAPAGIPEVVLAAYRRAAAASAISAPGCGLSWWMLAAVGKMESDHADGGRLDPAGNTRDPIFGPWLDGSNGTAAIPASGAGPVWERAAGPMQFLPATWARYGSGDVHDQRDSILGAARYLVANGAPGDMPRALFHYNPSRGYVRAIQFYARHMQEDERAFFGFYSWQVLYKHVDGTMILPEGYPKARPVPVPVQ